MTGNDGWAGRAAPGIAEFEAIANEVLAGLGEEFRRACGGIVIAVEDFPSEDVIAEMELESAYDILGLFQGVGRTERGDSPLTGEEPNMIWLYRRPILDYWAEYEETLGHIIAHVLIHEIGHHMGFSDEDMERIEDAAGIE